MARSRTRTRLKTRHKTGFKLPTQAKIKTLLRKRSKVFLIGCIMWLFGKISKGDKIRLLIKIEKGRIRRVSKHRKSKTRKATRRKTRRKSKSHRSPAQKRNDKRLGRMAKARAKKRR